MISSNPDGKCPYSETWIFCSDGSGETPKGGKADYQVNKEKNSTSIIPFLETVSEYNRKGGALLLFCDNEPFTFEANLLLQEYLNFEFEKKGKKGANFIMKGNYNTLKKEDKIIEAFNPNKNNSYKGCFRAGHFIESPGDLQRFSLRIGIEKFNEGITLSYAETLDNSDDYFPFTPFAYLSDKSKERPFILYYDPKISEERGPIVVHGGFTSAFYDFQLEGTGKLLISIVCWLMRCEEKIKKQIDKSNENNNFKKPLINKINEIKINKIFKDWYKYKLDIVYMVDATFSMDIYINSVKDQCKNISNELKEKYKDYDVHFGCVFYRDPIDSKGDINENISITNNIDELKNNIGKIEVKGGGDEAEDWIGAYKLVLSDEMKWRDGIKLIIHIADYGGHGKDYSDIGDDKHQELGEELSPLIKKIVDKGIRIVGFKIKDSASKSFEKCKNDYEKYDINKKGFYIINKFEEINKEKISEYLKEMVLKAAEAATKY